MRAQSDEHGNNGIPATPVTPGAPQGAAAGNAAGVVFPDASVVDTLRARSVALHAAVDTTGLSRDAVLSVERSMEVQMMPSFIDIDPSYRQAIGTTKAILTPIDGHAAAYIREGGRIADWDESLAAFRQMWRTAARTEVVFMEWFPDGSRAFANCKDNNMPAEQFSVIVADHRLAEFSAFITGMGFSILVCSGALMPKVTMSIAVEEKKGKRFIPPGQVVREIFKQTGLPVMVSWNKKDYAGQRIYSSAYSESQASYITEQGGIKLFSPVKQYQLINEIPIGDRECIFFHTDRANGLGPYKDFLGAAIAGYMRCTTAQLTFSVVAKSETVRDTNIIKMEYNYSPDAYDQAFRLCSMRVMRFTHPRLAENGGFIAKIAGSLDEMQSLMRIKLLKPPVMAEIEEDEDDEVVTVAPAIAQGQPIITPAAVARAL